jgi:hypothetical protein
MSDWASGEGYTTLEDVFASRDFGRHPQAASSVPAARPAPRAGRAHLFTNRAIAVISAGAAGLSVVATLVVNGGGPALSPVISAQRAPANVPDFLTPVPQGSVGQGAAGGSAGAGATGSSGGAATAPGAVAGGGSSVGAGTTSGGSGGTTVVALGPTPASASLASFTVSHPTQKPPPPPPPAPSSTTTTTTQPPPISAGGNVSGGRDNGKGNGGQNNGNGAANGVANNGGGTVFVSAVSSPARGRGNG